MGSIMMHLYISEIYKEKHKLSNKFLIGSVLPDIYKKTIMNRDESHYIEIVKKKDEVFKLPNIDKFIKENKEKKSDEITMGYLAHLVEDYIWFRYIINKQVRECGKDESGNPQYRYKKEKFKVLHNSEHFTENIYADYSYLDIALIERIPIDIEEIEKETLEFLGDDEKSKKIVKEQLHMHRGFEERENCFITDKVLSKYIRMSLRMLEKELKRFAK